MNNEVWPRDLRGFILAMFNYDIVWSPYEDEEPPF